MSTQQTEVQSEAAQTRRAVGNILKGSAGNLVEWYDLYVYTRLRRLLPVPLLQLRRTISRPAWKRWPSSRRRS